MIKENIAALIKTGQIIDAIELMVKYKPNLESELDLQLARWNSLQNEIMAGVISFENKRMARSQTVFALNNILNKNFIGSETTSDASVYKSNGGLTSELNEIIKKHSRRNPEIASIAEKLLEDIKNYDLSKLKHSSFDVSGRRYRDIEKRYRNLQARVESNNEKKLESIVDKVNNLIKEDAPSYHDLDEAHKLVIRRGFNNEWVTNSLNAKPDDKEVRIAIAEYIEEFLSTLN